ncbi:MAG: penicillin-insensitive murein endopeptidase [Pseudomonadota bacterium]
MKITLIIFLTFFQHFTYAENIPSSCYGSTQDGRLENGWQLPSSGKNFAAYSSVGVMLGRNYVHSKVHSVVMNAYKELETSAPGKVFVYGESGFKEGGLFKPHKTHRNGLSVDFFVPVKNAKGVSVKLPISALNKFGYNIEFNEDARFDDYTIDFEAMAQHLLAIYSAAKSEGIGIRVVIFENSFQKKLFSTATGKGLTALMPFSVKKPWVRHDEHYHIDFVVSCKNNY